MMQILTTLVGVVVLVFVAVKLAAFVFKFDPVA